MKRLRKFLERGVRAQRAVDAIIVPARTARDSRDDLLIVGEVARICRCSERTVRHWIAIGKLRTYRVGRRHLMRREDVATMLARAEIDNA